ncbi:DNA N-6-adenine-methyltransferase [Shinella zoogloeoides]|uniref:DNA N-6-adenine-methyltransferase n=1 Tax=Shinella zoogloeoides TaxID=352475 RepID=UPI00299D61A7|nr:DNA N-6-adenine-methyltransferase [Shinella zoogloeoides]WPE19890.1 hypothetical protein ShzoTeo12_10660 [Shinella zoogloeoides]
MTGNLFAGMGGHHGARSTTDVWLTPPAIIEALGGPESFDLDPCSLAGRPWPTARVHFTPADNGLLLPWDGRVWLNPPYSTHLIRRFMARMADHGRGVALIFARTETDHFQRFVFGAASAVLFLAGRINFHLPDGRRASKNGGAPSALVAYGEDDRDILAHAPIAGAFVALRLPTSVLVGALSETWAQALRTFFERNPEQVSLQELYRAFSNHPKTRANAHWRDKLRQVLQRGNYERVERGVWRRLSV